MEICGRCNHRLDEHHAYSTFSTWTAAYCLMQGCHCPQYVEGWVDRRAV